MLNLLWSLVYLAWPLAYAKHLPPQGHNLNENPLRSF